MQADGVERATAARGCARWAVRVFSDLSSHGSGTAGVAGGLGTRAGDGLASRGPEMGWRGAGIAVPPCPWQSCDSERLPPTGVICWGVLHSDSVARETLPSEQGVL